MSNHEIPTGSEFWRPASMFEAVQWMAGKTPSRDWHGRIHFVEGFLVGVEFSDGSVCAAQSKWEQSDCVAPELDSKPPVFWIYDPKEIG